MHGGDAIRAAKCSLPTHPPNGTPTHTAAPASNASYRFCNKGCANGNVNSATRSALISNGANVHRSNYGPSIAPCGRHPVPPPPHPPYRKRDVVLLPARPPWEPSALVRLEGGPYDGARLEVGEAVLELGALLIGVCSRHSTPCDCTDILLLAYSSRPGKGVGTFHVVEG
jgi:hypothetical protein